AVPSFVNPAQRYTGSQKMIASFRCVSPHNQMKAMNNHNILLSGTGMSIRRLIAYKSNNGIAMYAKNIAESEPMCSQPWASVQRPQCHRAGKSEVSNSF